MFSAAMLGPPINPDEGSSEIRNESSSSVYTISHTVLYVRGAPGSGSGLIIGIL